MTNLERLFREDNYVQSMMTTYVIYHVPRADRVEGGRLYDWLLEEEVAPPVAADGAGKDMSTTIENRG